MDRDTLLEFVQWLANDATRLTTLADAIEEDDPDTTVNLIDKFLKDNR